MELSEARQVLCQERAEKVTVSSDNRRLFVKNHHGLKTKIVLPLPVFSATQPS
jgi:hypothetical protein